MMILKKPKQSNNKKNCGAAMIVVVCVMAVVMILSLTLLMAVYQMLATVSDEGRDELYYQQAMSFSKVLTQRLENKTNGDSSDELVNHIDEFMSGADYKDVDKETLKADAPTDGGVYGGITLVLDKKSSRGNLVVTISIDDGEKTMASCTCKFETHDDEGAMKYTFQGYY